MNDMPITRRQSLGYLLAGATAAGGAVTALKGEDDAGAAKPARRMPALFIAHGAPPLLDIPEWVKELHDWAGKLPRPKAILMISAHWEQRPATVGATRPVPLVYDFYGFPERYYKVTYPAPGAPDLAARVGALLGNVAQDPARGLDHGAYVPLVAMYPAADIPVLQLSLPTLDARELFEVGRKLAPLRDEGVLVIGSGFLTHNMRAIDPRPGATPPAWASEFDAWAGGIIARRDHDALVDYRARAPGVRIALPTHEHFVPMIVAAGAAEHDAATFPITGFWMGGFTRRSVQLG